MGTFGRSFQLIKESFRVLTMDPEILVFVLLAALCITSIYAGLGAYLYMQGGVDHVLGFLQTIQEGDYVAGALLVLMSVTSLAVWKFFESAMMTCAYIRLKGGSPTFGDGIGNAAKNFTSILKWSVVSFVVNYILRLIGSRTGIVGRIVTWVVNVAWEMVTIFVLPVMIFEGMGVRKSIVKSAQLFKRTWGENLVGQFSMDILVVVFVVVALGVFVASMSFLIYSGQSAALDMMVVILGALFVFIVASLLVSSALSSVFSTALYIYATTGAVPSAFSEDLIKGAFKQKSSKSILSKTASKSSNVGDDDKWKSLREKYSS